MHPFVASTVIYAFAYNIVAINTHMGGHINHTYRLSLLVPCNIFQLPSSLFEKFTFPLYDSAP